MKTTTKWIMVCVLLMTIIACKKSHDSVTDPEPDPDTESVIEGAVHTEHGELIDSPVQQVIGPAGGQISIPEKGVTLRIPEGAVDKDITFSIQEVSTTLTEGVTGTTFRLLPEDVEFNKDVEITLPYSEKFMSINSFAYETLSPVYQDKKGYWHVVKDRVVDQYTHTVTAKTRHFSDWSTVAHLYIKADDKIYLDKGQSHAFTVCFLPSIEDTTSGPSVDDLLGTSTDSPTDVKVQEWYFAATSTYDMGTLAGGQSFTANYTAPSTIPVMMNVFIGVKVKVNSKLTRELRTFLTLLPEEYCYYESKSTVNNGSYSAWCSDKVEVYPGDDMFVNFYSLTHYERFHIEAISQSKGKYVFGEKVSAAVYMQSEYFTSTYTSCDSSEPLYGKGDLVIYDTDNGLISGDIQGELRLKKKGTGKCHEPPTIFSVKFRYKKKE